jgi:hypothetical protein
MTLLTVCPVIIPPRPGLIDSWNHPDHFVIVNGAHDEWRTVLEHQPWSSHTPDTLQNLGCPTSWNIGFRHARELGHDHVAILSQSTILHAGTRRLAATFASAARHAPPAKITTTQHSFHCVVISVRCWEQLDGFDESLPVWADIDFVRRAWLADPDLALASINVPGLDERCAALRYGVVDASLYHNDKTRYAVKWGGPVTAETYPQPWEPCSATPDASTPHHMFSGL